MPYEIFLRKTRRMGTPSVTFNKMGRIQFNKTATAKLEKEAVEYVLLLWDAELNKVGVRLISKKDPRAYKLSYGVKGNGAGFSAKTFFDYIGLDYTETRTAPVEIGEGEILLEFQIPSDYFSRQRQQHLALEGGKRGKTA
jgi:hypothetical protein